MFKRHQYGKVSCSVVSSNDVVVDDIPLVKLKEAQITRFRGLEKNAKVAAKEADKVYVPKANQGLDLDYFAT